MAIKGPTTNPHCSAACIAAVEPAFTALTFDAAQAGWDPEATAQALEEIARNHRRSVEAYRDLGIIPEQKWRKTPRQ